MRNSIKSLRDDFKELAFLMRQTTENLKRMAEIQASSRFQLGDSDELEKFSDELDKTVNGWMSSNC